ncbi:MAG TPA: iron-containing alcohol dehydrogenase, partial [Thermodesulfobacteriota bacterium]|nr:iron-containing alcohol dehydrogenase [Thermodesulfobacteriota bacterium]
MIFPAFNTVRRIVSGFNSLESIGEEAKRLGGRRVLVVTDPGIKAAGLLDGLVASLEKAGLSCQVFSGVEPDPKIEVVFSSLEAAKAYRPDLIVGLGGGSSLDISKVTSVMLANDGPLDKYFGMELVPRPGVPLILVPTTAGTGSEMTSICVL